MFMATDVGLSPSTSQQDDCNATQRLSSLASLPRTCCLTCSLPSPPPPPLSTAWQPGSDAPAVLPAPSPSLLCTALRQQHLHPQIITCSFCRLRQQLDMNLCPRDARQAPSAVRAVTRGSRSIADSSPSAPAVCLLGEKVASERLPLRSKETQRGKRRRQADRREEQRSADRRVPRTVAAVDEVSRVRRGCHEAACASEMGVN